MNKITNFLDSLDYEVTTNKKTLFFEILAAVGLGVIIGAIFAPKISVKVLSDNEAKLDNVDVQLEDCPLGVIGDEKK
jgi:hypothetical protein